MNRNIFIFVVSIILSACSDSNSDDESVLAKTTFTEETIALAGKDASNCGTVASSEARDTINSCAIDALNMHQPFYAIYNIQGVDSRVADSIVYNGTDFYILHFDDWSCWSDGNENCDTSYGVSECVSPSIRDITPEQAMYTYPFECEEKIRQ